MATDVTLTRPTRSPFRRPTILGLLGRIPAVIGDRSGDGLNALFVRPGQASSPIRPLGSASIQKPPSGNFYCAGQFCPLVDRGETTQDSAGRTLTGQDDNGLRWKCA